MVGITGRQAQQPLAHDRLRPLHDQMLLRVLLNKAALVLLL
jgi:hypothetical protein